MPGRLTISSFGSSSIFYCFSGYFFCYSSIFYYSLGSPSGLLEGSSFATGFVVVSAFTVFFASFSVSKRLNNYLSYSSTGCIFKARAFFGFFMIFKSVDSSDRFLMILPPSSKSSKILLP